MSNQQNGTGSQQSATTATTAIGGRTSGEAGATPDHETMAETGGSGGDALTQPRDIERAPLAGSRQSADGNRQGEQDVIPEGAGTAATATARGAQDTRSRQAGLGETGLGTPETGGNQDEGDLPPPR